MKPVMKMTTLVASLFTLFCLSTNFAYSATNGVMISGPDVRTGKAVSIPVASGKFATAVVFMSAKCPCSASHETLLKELQEKNPDIAFVGVHSNRDESIESAKDHFNGSTLPFPIVQDDQAKLAKELGAFKTPHVFLYNQSGERVYDGGVTDTHIASQAHVQYLADAISDLRAGRKPRTDHGRTLGCVIMRN